ncbi:hypothetical protein SNEBB_010415 [Seison nebaliae]|nr:hypothetical protein SNEBB_010415 [Seison nebaliae]
MDVDFGESYTLSFTGFIRFFLTITFYLFAIVINGGMVSALSGKTNKINMRLKRKRIFCDVLMNVIISDIFIGLNGILIPNMIEAVYEYPMRQWKNGHPILEKKYSGIVCQLQTMSFLMVLIMNVYGLFICIIENYIYRMRPSLFYYEQSIDKNDIDRTINNHKVLISNERIVAQKKYVNKRKKAKKLRRWIVLLILWMCSLFTSIIISFVWSSKSRFYRVEKQCDFLYNDCNKNWYQSFYETNTTCSTNQHQANQSLLFYNFLFHYLFPSVICFIFLLMVRKKIKRQQRIQPIYSEINFNPSFSQNSSPANDYLTEEQSEMSSTVTINESEIRENQNNPKFKATIFNDSITIQLIILFVFQTGGLLPLWICQFLRYYKFEDITATIELTSPSVDLRQLEDKRHYIWMVLYFCSVWLSYITLLIFKPIILIISSKQIRKSFHRSFECRTFRRNYRFK